jgi:hypothetical protein
MVARNWLPFGPFVPGKYIVILTLYFKYSYWTNYAFDSKCCPLRTRLTETHSCITRAISGKGDQ